MISIDADDLESLVDDLAKEFDRMIHFASEKTARYIQGASPVMTGAFRGSFEYLVDSDKGRMFISQDPESAETLGRLIRESRKFSTLNNDTITLSNDVENEDGENYAATVGFDFSGDKAESLMYDAQVMFLDGLEE